MEWVYQCFRNIICMKETLKCFSYSEKSSPMGKFGSQKKVRAESATKWMINNCQEGLFLKRCYIEIELTLQNVWGIFRRIAGILALFQIYSTISCGTADDGVRNLGWETLDKMIFDCTEILLQRLNKESNWEHKNPELVNPAFGQWKEFRTSRLRSWNAINS